MKREEQIRQAALAYSFDTDGGHSGDLNAGRDDFIEGAKWADEHPATFWHSVADGVMRAWIARDRDGLFIYTQPPAIDPIREDVYMIVSGTILPIDKNLFPEVTFENSPQTVEIKLVNDYER